MRHLISMIALAFIIALAGNTAAQTPMPPKKSGPTIIALPPAKKPVDHKIDKVVELESDLTLKGDSKLAKGTIFTGTWTPKGASVVISGTKIDVPSVSKELTVDLSVPDGNVIPKGTRLAPGSSVVLDADAKLPEPLLPFGAGAIKPGKAATPDELTTEALIARARLKVVEASSKDAKVAVETAKTTKDKLEKTDKNVHDVAKTLGELAGEIMAAKKDAAEAKQLALAAKKESTEAKDLAQTALQRVGTMDGKLAKAIEKFGGLSDKLTELEGGIKKATEAADEAVKDAKDAKKKAGEISAEATDAKTAALSVTSEFSLVKETATQAGKDAKLAKEIAEAAGGDAKKLKELLAAPLVARWTKDFGDKTEHMGWVYEKVQWCVGSWYEYRRASLAVASK